MSLFKKKHVALGFLAAVVTLGFPGIVVRAQQQSFPPEVLAWADTVLYNGQILTVDDAFTITEAVAIRDEKFLAVGTNERIRAMAGPKTRLIDLKGRTVVPGFIDTHHHFHNYAQRGLMPRILFRTREQWLREIKRLVDVAEPGEWVILRADRTVDQPWAQSAFAMTRHDLTPSRPTTRSSSGPALRATTHW